MDRLISRLPMRLCTDGGPSVDLKVSCYYSADDPYAVKMNFGRVGDAEEAVWVVSRELLMVGLQARAGLGDTFIRPWDDGHTLITLLGDTGRALLRTPTRELSAFLAATAQLVPVGTESTRIDWDAWIGHILSA
ncbi:SsgA family sporulation/cell division regulator [Streptomyces sp. NPDC008238]